MAATQKFAKADKNALAKKLAESRLKRVERASGLPQRAGAFFAPSLVPATDRLAMNFQRPGNLALAQASVEKSGGLESPSFQFFKIAFSRSEISSNR